MYKAVKPIDCDLSLLDRQHDAGHMTESDLLHLEREGGLLLLIFPPP